tara:strand:- start:82 stop:285 length:204 start_codon:yes stop_codon:yes gene_type:complete
LGGERQKNNLKISTVQAFLEEVLEDEKYDFQEEFTITDIQDCESLSENGTFECIVVFNWIYLNQNLD